MILIPLEAWAAIVLASVLAAFWSPARTLALALGASWLLSIGAFYWLSLPVRPTANTVIDLGMFMMALSQWRKCCFAAGTIAGISIALIAAHFAFAWHGAAYQARYEDVVNLLFIGECIIIGGAGLWHVVANWSGRVAERTLPMRSASKPGGAHGSR